MLIDSTITKPALSRQKTKKLIYNHQSPVFFCFCLLSFHSSGVISVFCPPPRHCPRASWTAEILPGGYASPARFVRTAYQKSFAATPANRQDAVTAGFHLLEGVALPRGVVTTSRGQLDFTHYTAFLNTASGEYFFRTYDNSQVTTARLPADAGSRPRPVRLGALNRQSVYATL